MFRIGLLAILISLSLSSCDQANYEVRVVQTAKDTGDRLTNKPSIYFTSKDFDSNETIVINTTQTFQKILGFGGAFTEAGAYVYSVLNETLQQKIMDLIFGSNGQNYAIGRVHINSCDFSLASYNFDDVDGDYSLENFDISHEEKWLIPFIKQALDIRGPLKIFATPWSPPAWMKGNGYMTGSSIPGLKQGDDYFQTWAVYYTKFLDAYALEGIDIWGITVQNEPENAAPWEACVYNPEQERDFIKNFLGPQLSKTHPNLTIMIYDHNKDHIATWAQTIYSDPEAASYVKGTAFHWYSGPQFENVQKTHDMFPDKFLLASEACTCPVQLGNWGSGESYGNDIIGDLNAWAVGWTDWNMLLDTKGGPNHSGGGCDAGLIADIDNQELYIQSQYYYMGHFSRFLVPESSRIGITYDSSTLQVTGVLTPNNEVALVVMNMNDNVVDFKLTHEALHTKYEIPGHGIVTFRYQNF